MLYSSSTSLFIRKANHVSSSQQCYTALFGKHMPIHPYLTFMILSYRVLHSSFFSRQSSFSNHHSSFIVRRHRRPSVGKQFTSLRRQEWHVAPFRKHLHLYPCLTFGIHSNKVLHSSFYQRRSSFIIHYSSSITPHLQFIIIIIVHHALIEHSTHLQPQNCYMTPLGKHMLSS